MRNGELINSDETTKGRRGCAVPTKCHTTRGRSFEEMMSSTWEEFVIRYDSREQRYITRTACCLGAPACC